MRLLLLFHIQSSALESYTYRLKSNITSLLEVVHSRLKSNHLVSFLP
jgi:hypothetical protein